MISFDEAVRLIEHEARPLREERVPIGEAAGRVLAAPAIARIDSPPADSSAMDGYAVRDSDLPGTLHVAGESLAGRGFEGALAPGTCVRIFTGAAVPPGADRVVIQEEVVRDGDQARFAGPPGEARHIRPQGSDFRAGETLLEAGRRLDSRALVAAASADMADVLTWREPQVLLLCTGDELAPPGQARSRPGSVPESVSFGVAALVRHWGGRCLGTRRLPDDLAALEQAAGEALEQADLVVVIGGASVGERDYARAMFAPHRLEPIFSKVAIKPGKPVWLGRAAGKLVIGLPGNPTSAMVTARLLLGPLVAGHAGRAGALDWRSVRLTAPLPACGDRETFHRARHVNGAALPVANADSSAQQALAEADLLLRSRPNEPEREAGEEIEALDF